MQAYPGFPPPFYPPPRRNNTNNYILIGLLVVICFILLYPLEYFYNGEVFMLILDEYLIDIVYKLKFKSNNDTDNDTDDNTDKGILPFEKPGVYVKESWSLFDFLMLSIIDNKSINIIFDSYKPIGVKLGEDSLYLNKEKSLLLLGNDNLSNTMMNEINMAKKKKNELKASEGFI